MIRLTGHIDVPEDRLDAVTAALPAHVALTHAEPGCLTFEVTPDAAVPGRFIVSESFTNRAAFDAHQTRARTSPWAEVTAGLPREYVIEDLDD
ncbi:putative quinol monooxygenase [Aliiroseovarius subalbicans]|uniref:putative quinol monooxygenase n=1 Tax=Aliiroseovarius subalbicans TaxID=2925840 RepID=UPI001F574E26|nr:putative quinol monooxygenase [Aliiroseovarius subalbicans]MCI2398412.1 antibiotic biosynthesis monooxygenase [Aliiroseovarius subalbicans]